MHLHPLVDFIPKQPRGYAEKDTANQGKLALATRLILQHFVEFFIVLIV